jgi:hypothetical protein
MLFDVSAGVETMRIIERNVGDVTILELEGRSGTG